MGRGPFDEPPLRTPPPVRRIVGPRSVPVRLDAVRHDLDDGFDLLGELDPDEEKIDVESADGAELDVMVAEVASSRTPTRTPLPEPEVMPDNIGEGLLPHAAPQPGPVSLVIGRRPVAAPIAPPIVPAGPLVTSRALSTRIPSPPPPPPMPEFEELDDEADEEGFDTEAMGTTEGPAALKGTSPIVCQLALCIAAEEVACEAGMILIECGGRLVVVAATGAGANQSVGRTFPSREGIHGDVFHTGCLVSAPVASQVPSYSEAFDRETGFHTRSILCVPIQSGGRARGVLQLLNRTGPQGFTNDDIDMLASVADVLGADLKWGVVEAELLPLVESSRH